MSTSDWIMIAAVFSFPLVGPLALWRLTRDGVPLERLRRIGVIGAVAAIALGIVSLALRSWWWGAYCIVFGAGQLWVSRITGASRSPNKPAAPAV